MSYVHTFYRIEVWYLRKCRTIVTQHNWVRTIYHHKLLVTYFDRTTVFHPLANLKRVFTIINRQCTENLLSKPVGDRKYEAIDRDQDSIGVLNLIKVVMLKFDRNKVLAHTMWEYYVSVF